MPVLVKVPPQDILARPLVVSVPKTRPGDISPEDVVYLWFSETSGGNGLAGRGTVTEVQRTGISSAEVRIRDFILTDITFGNRQIGAFRDSQELSPESTLAKKVYRYALNRSVRLSQGEAVFLDQFIGR